MWARLIEAVSLGRVKLVDDSDALQLIQVEQGPMPAKGARRILDKIPSVMTFGFTSVPPTDTDVVIVRLPGNRALSIAIGSNHRASRLKNLKPGDAAIYDVRGAYVKMTDQGIEVDAAGLNVLVKNTPKVRFDTPLVEVTGDVVSRADGTRVSLNALNDAYKAHKHGGVAAGGAQTALSDHLATSG